MRTCEADTSQQGHSAIAAIGLRRAYAAAFAFSTGQWAAGVTVALAVVSLGGTAGDAGLIAGVRFGLAAILSLPLGGLADKRGTGRTLLLGASLAAVAHALPILALVTGSLIPLYGWALGAGIAASMYYPASSAYVGGTAHLTGRGRALGWNSAATNAGITAGLAIAGFVIEFAGFPAAFSTAAVVGLSAAIITHTRLPVQPWRDVGPLVPRLRRLAGDQHLVAAWLAAFAIGVCWGAVLGLYPVFAKDTGVEAAAIGGVLAFQAAANGLSRLPVGSLKDRFTIPWWTSAAAAVAYAALVSTLGVQEDLLITAALLGFGGLCVGTALVLIHVTMIDRVPGETRGLAMGGYNGALSAGLGLGPFVGGLVASYAGWPLAFLSVGLLGGVTALCSVSVVHLRSRVPSV